MWLSLIGRRPSCPQRATHLDNLGVDLFGADNGVWLPSAYYSGMPSFVGAFHRGAPEQVYTDYVEMYLLSATTKNDAIERLDDLRAMLRNGCIRLSASAGRQEPHPPRAAVRRTWAAFYRQPGRESLPTAMIEPRPIYQVIGPADEDFPRVVPAHPRNRHLDWREVWDFVQRGTSPTQIAIDIFIKTDRNVDAVWLGRGRLLCGFRPRAGRSRTDGGRTNAVPGCDRQRAPLLGSPM